MLRRLQLSAAARQSRLRLRFVSHSDGAHAANRSAQADQVMQILPGEREVNQHGHRVANRCGPRSRSRYAPAGECQRTKPGAKNVLAADDLAPIVAILIIAAATFAGWVIWSMPIPGG